MLIVRRIKIFAPTSNLGGPTGDLVNREYTPNDVMQSFLFLHIFQQAPIVCAATLTHHDKGRESGFLVFWFSLEGKTNLSSIDRIIIFFKFQT